MKISESSESQYVSEGLQEDRVLSTQYNFGTNKHGD